MIKFISQEEETNYAPRTSIEYSISDEVDCGKLFDTFCQFVLSMSYSEVSIAKWVQETAGYLDNGATIRDVIYY